MTAHPLERPALARFALLQAQGQAARAQAVLWQALAQEPNLPRVHLALARLHWPGPDYRHWLAWLHRELQPRLYVEIGVEKGESLKLALPPTQALGIDPAPAGDPLAACTAPTRLYRQASAEFLRSPPEGCGLSEQGFDLAFVDGDHRFSSVLEDFIGLERWAAPGAVMVLHDTLPLTDRTATEERQSGFYTGDGWKILSCLRALRPELRVVTLPIAPTGFTLVAGLDPRSQVLRERKNDILQAYAGVGAQRIVERPAMVAGPLGVSEAGWVRRWLRDAGVPPRN
ncbi:MAG: class I SAM-dependent methyltransferase [Ramlibacter sp.]